MVNFLVFPNQLYKYVKHLQNTTVYLIEEPRYFTDFKFHKLKLAYHRATMKKYYKYLKNKGLSVYYINYYKVSNKFYKKLIKASCIDIADYKLETKLKKLLDLTVLNNINFLIDLDEIQTLKQTIFKKNYSHSEFYKYMRKKYNILMKNDMPINNKWSYDRLNRLKLPDNIKIPKLINKLNKNKYIDEAKIYVEKYFPNNYGSLDNFIYPIDYKATKKWLNKFLKERLPNFGKYEDAIDTNNDFIFHSVLTPMLNIGLITDIDVINISDKHYHKYKNKNNISIESYEGFIRQIIGWRNYVYVMYKLEGIKMINSNLLNNKYKSNKLYKKLWEGTTGILPVDTIITKIIKYGYMHHIERLMVLGNYMLLLLLHPKFVYKMFMEWSIDSYDWVMVPNVYGMSNYATDIMMTRPYFSSSNYILKMSNIKKNNVWEKIWDVLYYNFIYKHHNLFKNNYGVAMQVKHWDNKNINDKNEIIKMANKYIKSVL